MELSPEIIRQYIEQQTCWICGKGGWKALSGHLARKHGLPAAEVREMAYMCKLERLISKELSERISKDALRRFGDKVFRKKKGERDPKHILSTKAKDIGRKKVEEIRPLAAIAQRKRRKSHYCKVCGKVVETSKPRYCSPECGHIALREAAKKNMTPGRIAFFKTVLYKPTSEEMSKASKCGWDKIRRLPIEEQKAYFARRVESRKSPLVNVFCVMCGEGFTIPGRSWRRATCSKICSKALKAKLGRERVIKPSTRIKLSELARKRHIDEPQFGRKVKVG